MLTSLRAANPNRAIVAIALATSIGFVACTNDDEAADGPPTPSSVVQADAQSAIGTPELRLGLVTNIAAPTAERDSQIVELFRTAAAASSSESTSVRVQIEEIRIDETDDIGPALDALLGFGITAVAATCDDGSVPQLIEEAVAADLLVVTSCITVPQADIGTSDPLFLDTANLDDGPNAITRWATELSGGEVARVATIGSDLVPGVIEVCDRVEGQIEQSNGSSTLGLSLHFTELIDDVGVALDEAAATLEEVDVIVACALSPTVGELVRSLRERGHEQSVIVPWFASDEQWDAEISNVHIIAPTSAGGDDPNQAINELYSEVENSTVLDVAVVDSLALLRAGIERSGSASPSRIADALTESPELVVPGGRFVQDERTIERDYRVIEITVGQASFTTIVQ